MTPLEWVKFAIEVSTLLGIFWAGIMAIRKTLNRRNEEQDMKLEALDIKIGSVDTKVMGLMVDLSSLTNQQRINEIDRLKETILTFAYQLRVAKTNPSVYEINLNSFTHIFECYTKYKDLGGNCYVDEEMKFVRDEFQRYHNI